MTDRSTGIAWQHQRLELALDELVDALSTEDVARCETAVLRLQGAIRAHFEVEERVVFPALREAQGDAMGEVDALERDHERLLRMLDALASSVVVFSEDALKGVLAEFRAALVRHERAEEQLLKRSS